MRRVIGGEPTAIPGNPNQMDIVFILVHGLKNRRRRQQRDFMFAAATAKENAYAQFFHGSGMKVQCTAKTKTSCMSKLIQFKWRGLGYSIRHDRAAVVSTVNSQVDIPHPYIEAKPTEEAANEATNTGRWPEGF